MTKRTTLFSLVVAASCGWLLVVLAGCGARSGLTDAGAGTLIA